MQIRLTPSSIHMFSMLCSQSKDQPWLWIKQADSSKSVAIELVSTGIVPRAWSGWVRDIGVTRLVHHSQLGNWDRSKEFWENTSLLVRAQGRIARINAPQSGEIEVQGGLKAFFVPARGNYSRGRSENRAVTFYLGFSYEGLRGWEVKDA